MDDAFEKRSIVVIDDDPSIEIYLKNIFNCSTNYFPSLHQYKNHAVQLHEPMVIFLDIHLDISDSGLELIPQLKKKWQFSPIIVMTAEKNTKKLVEALAFGADDFVYKPFSKDELLARVKVRVDALTRLKCFSEIEVGDLTINLEHRSIINDEGQIQYISPTEINLLKCLVASKGLVVSRNSLKLKCWGQINVTDNALNRKLHSLRSVLIEMSQKVSIKTVYGTGFSLQY